MYTLRRHTYTHHNKQHTETHVQPRCLYITVRSNRCLFLYVPHRFPAELSFVHTGQYPQDLPHPAQAGKYGLSLHALKYSSALLPDLTFMPLNSLTKSIYTGVICARFHH